MSFLAGIASGVLGQMLKAALDAVLTYLQQQQARADQIALGQQQQMTADTVTALQLQQKMQTAAVQPHDVAAAIEALNAGKF